jgi:hypothetical protein
MRSELGREQKPIEENHRVFAMYIYKNYLK